MFMISAFIRPFRLENVRSELLSRGLVGMTVNECSGHGRNAVLVPGRRMRRPLSNLSTKLKIEIAVGEQYRDLAIQAIMRGARLGEIGDGKIFVARLDHVVTIRTGECDDEALAAPTRLPEAAE